VTSAIDLQTDTTIHDVLLGLPCTVLMICHRIHRIQHFDHVIVSKHTHTHTHTHAYSLCEPLILMASCVGCAATSSARAVPHVFCV
jgi:ABC-type bacteriocin/lantibiotic exporter with double-glycine peptidase domain